MGPWEPRARTAQRERTVRTARRVPKEQRVRKGWWVQTERMARLGRRELQAGQGPRARQVRKEPPEPTARLVPTARQEPKAPMAFPELRALPAAAKTDRAGSCQRLQFLRNRLLMFGMAGGPE